MKNKEKKHVLVVGGSGGIGLAIVKRLIKDGFFVSATYFSTTPVDLEMCHWYKLDVNNKEDISEIIKQARENNGEINVVIYGPTCEISLQPISKLNWESVEKHLNIQARGFFYTVKTLLPGLKENPIHFVTILTEACFDQPPARFTDYVCAKYALMGLAKSMAVELVNSGSSVSMVSPGMTDTKLIANFPPKFIELTAEQNPKGRIATPDDVANTVSILVNGEAKSLNGKNFFVDYEF